MSDEPNDQAHDFAILAIQCDDRDGKRGCFLARPKSEQHPGRIGTRQISDTWPDLVAAFYAIYAAGWVQMPHDPEYPTGKYWKAG
jgi:hypothetical protein